MAEVSALAQELAATVRHLARMGWASGTGGNFSAALEPVTDSKETNALRLLITPSGVDKRLLRAHQLLTIDGAGCVVAGEGAASAETLIHLAIARQRGAGSILHTHSIWNTLLSHQNETTGSLSIAGFEMLKGLQGVKTHRHRETVPILPNSQDMNALSAQVTQTLERFPDCHGILLSGHGLYTWGDSIATARRHVEIFEFLFECVARERACDAR